MHVFPRVSAEVAVLRAHVIKSDSNVSRFLQVSAEVTALRAHVTRSNSNVSVVLQVSAEVAALRADVYRLHAAMQGATPTGQRLIVQPDRVDPTRPKGRSACRHTAE